MAFSIQFVRELTEKIKNNEKFSIEQEIEKTPVIKLGVTKEFYDTIMTMATICNDGNEEYWLFESQRIKLIVIEE